MFPGIEDNPGETLFREYFYPCRTLELYDKNNKRRIFVEYSEATDYGQDMRRDGEKPDMSLCNAVRKLLQEKNDSFFFARQDVGVNSHVLIDGTFYWLKCKDITEICGNHLWVRTKRPMIGFKTITKDGKSVVSTYLDESFTYSMGQTYSVSEEKMFNDNKGFFFSPQLRKALSYASDDTYTYVVIAYGLMMITNRWDDLRAQNLTIVRRLTRQDIKLMSPEANGPKGFWNGYDWDSFDDDFCSAFLC